MYHHILLYSNANQYEKILNNLTEMNKAFEREIAILSTAKVNIHSKVHL